MKNFLKKRLVLSPRKADVAVVTCCEISSLSIEPMPEDMVGVVGMGQLKSSRSSSAESLATIVSAEAEAVAVAEAVAGPPTTPTSSPARRVTTAAAKEEDTDKNGMAPLCSSCHSSPNNRSMGAGSFSSLGSVSSFIPSPNSRRSKRGAGTTTVHDVNVHTAASLTTTTTTPSKEQRQPQTQTQPQQTPILLSMSATAATAVDVVPVVAAVADTTCTSTSIPVVFIRRLSSFLRVADLEMDPSMSLHSAASSSSSSSSIEGIPSENTGGGADADAAVGIIHPNFHHVAVNPPPGMTEEPLERWVALDDGAGLPAPIAPFAVAALAKTGLQSALNKQMWTAGDAKTKSLEAVPGGWHEHTWKAGGGDAGGGGGDAGGGCVENVSHSRDAVLVWTGKFQHGHYGSQLPAVRTAGFIQMSAAALTELLVDSARCKEYNKLSVGRTDLLVLQEKMSKFGPFGGVTKVMKSESRPPMLRKTLQFISILHAAELPDGSGYLIVSRAVTTPAAAAAAAEEEVKPKQVSHGAGAGILKSEILMGVNIIKRVVGDDNRCLLVTVNHIRSPMVPMMIAKRLGLQAAVNFIQDLRACAAAAAAAATATDHA